MTGVAYVIVFKRVAMRQANLAAVTVAARVAAVVTNVSSGSRAAANRNSIVHNDRRVVAVNGIKLYKPESRKELTEFAEFAEPVFGCLCCPSNWLELSLSLSDLWLRFCSH